MTCWMTRDERAGWGHVANLHVKKPNSMADGCWPQGFGQLNLLTLLDDQDEVFPKAFPLKPGGGPVKVELRVME